MPTFFLQSIKLFKKRGEMHDDTGTNDPRDFRVDQSYNAPGGRGISTKVFPSKLN